MLPSRAIRLLISPKTCYTYNSLAKMLIRQFVSNYATYYGEEHIGYNIHGLSHIVDYVLIYENLDFHLFKKKEEI